MRPDNENTKHSRSIRLILVAVALVIATGAIVMILLPKSLPAADALAELETVPASSSQEAAPIPEQAPPSEETPPEREGPSTPPPLETPPASPNPEAPSPLSVGIEVGQLAPDFVLPGLTGSAVTLSSLRGRVVLLDFWASWCAPCRATMPSLEALALRYKDKGVVLVGVSLDRTAEDATAYLKASGSTSLVALWGSLVQAREIARVYGIVGIPHTFVIDRQGVIRFADHPARLKDTLIDAWL